MTSTSLVVRDTARALSAQHRQRALELLAHIRRNTAAITDAFFEIGEALAEIHNNQLYVALGYRSFAALLEDEQILGKTQASKLIAVATLLPRETAVRLGPEKSYLLIRYARETQAPLKQLVRANAEIEGTPLQEMTIQRFRELTQKRPQERTRIRRDDEQAASRAQRELRRRGMASASVKAAGERFVVSLDRADLKRLLRD